MIFIHKSTTDFYVVVFVYLRYYLKILLLGRKVVMKKPLSCQKPELIKVIDSPGTL